MLTVNLDKSLVFVIVRFHFLNLFPFNLVFSRGGGRAPLELPGGQEDYCPPYVRHCVRVGGRETIELNKYKEVTELM